MDDIELKKLCAEALHDDAKAMALVKTLRLTIDRPDDDGDWSATYYDDAGNNPRCGVNKNLNRAIVLCIARMQASSLTPR